jgi:hypothetical protein
LFNLEYLSVEERIQTGPAGAEKGPEIKDDESKYGKGPVIAQAAA